MINLNRKKEMPEDPGGSGSMNDLSFLLIIFFIVIASFTINKGFLLNLPDKSTPKIVNTQDLIKCTLCENGMLILDDETVSFEQLETVLLQKKSHYPNMTFLLEVEENTEYQKFVDVVDKIRRMDIENFSFRMKKTEEQ